VLPGTPDETMLAMEQSAELSAAKDRAGASANAAEPEVKEPKPKRTAQANTRRTPRVDDRRAPWGFADQGHVRNPTWGYGDRSFGGRDERRIPWGFAERPYAATGRWF